LEKAVKNINNLSSLIFILTEKFENVDQLKFWPRFVSAYWFLMLSSSLACPEQKTALPALW